MQKNLILYCPTQYSRYHYQNCIIQILNVGYLNLTAECERVFDSLKVVRQTEICFVIISCLDNRQITMDQVTLVEKETRGQSTSKT